MPGRLGGPPSGWPADLDARRSELPITFVDVCVRVGTTQILEAISLTIGAGRPTVLIGPNGSGKTTLIRTAIGLNVPSSGVISWGGQPTPPNRRLAIVFQRPAMLRRSCEANVRYALAAAGVPRALRSARASELLRSVGLTSLADRPARRLSGGEQHRVALARALASDPAVLFLDEPTASLDPGVTQEIEETIRAVSAQGVKIVMATHDLGEARRLAGEIVMLHRGRILEKAPAEEFFAAPRTDQARRFLAGELLL